MKNSVVESIHTKEIWLIHGANSTPLSFRWVKEQLAHNIVVEGVKVVEIAYDYNEDLNTIISKLCSKMPTNKKVYLVGHSLGGIVAVALSQLISKVYPKTDVAGVFTISSPFLGSEGARLLSWMFPSNNLYKTIRVDNLDLKSIRMLGTPYRTLNVITTKGDNPLFYGELNDGVVTVESQMALSNTEKIYIPHNHYEILVSDEIITTLLEFLHL